jgi:hypothetical protein
MVTGSAFVAVFFTVTVVVPSALALMVTLAAVIGPLPAVKETMLSSAIVH